MESHENEEPAVGESGVFQWDELPQKFRERLNTYLPVEDLVRLSETNRAIRQAAISQSTSGEVTLAKTDVRTIYTQEGLDAAVIDDETIEVQLWPDQGEYFEVDDSTLSWEVDIRARGATELAVKESAQVFVYDTTKVEAYGEARVYAYDNVTVDANDNCWVMAYDNVVVNANDDVWVMALGPNVQVHRSGNAQVIVQG